MIEHITLKVVGVPGLIYDPHRTGELRPWLASTLAGQGMSELAGLVMTPGTVLAWVSDQENRDSGNAEVTIVSK